MKIKQNHKIIQIQLRKKMSSDNSADLASKYQQKTDKQHILDNPDTYIGAVEEIESNQWILSEDGTKIVEKSISYIPGLFKLFDEGIVNCRDHVVRMLQAIANNQENSLPVSHIDVTIDEEGVITMLNDGNGIDVAMHPEYNIWIPELIFGHLRTSTNYNKEEKKIVGGKNGFGFKLVLIWSSWGSIETVDHVRGLKYKQEFRNNLDIIGKPSVTKATTKKPYTKISFKPDYARLNLPGLTADWFALLKKRVYDLAAVTDKGLKIRYNDTLIPVKNFQQYIDMYIGPKETAPRVYEEYGTEGRWEYAVALTPSNEFVQISFVNGINTSKGGKHVEYILNQILRKMMDYIEKKKKTKVSFNSIRDQLILFLRCDIENPAFDSQTKDYMNTPSFKFGSKCEVSDKFIEKLAKMGVMDAACAITEVKENRALKRSDGVKSKKIFGIPKLDDANWAGTSKSNECTIIFCEGDSAKAGIISGLSPDDRNVIGVYPMKGKVLNVRGEVTAKIAANEEIIEIKKILGLESGKTYTNTDSLRYGKVLFMTDQDLDGSHIKGLGINLFQCEWPSLLQIPGFLGFMNTPILKAKKGSQELCFYNNGEYESWKQDAANSPSQWTIKYYKGLGTSTGKEFKEYFRQKKLVGFQHTGAASDDAIDMVFNKKRADDRKTWLETVYNRNAFLNTSQAFVPYENFINEELIHFSKYDCDRSIPNVMDGLKISLRKILYGAFKKRLTTEIKVAQFSGYVSEHSGYHHGEASLNQAIKGLAQNFVGSNNINLLYPSGQFGTRKRGGADSASERYIFTRLEKITRCIFPEADDAVLQYLDDDGFPVEPLFYAPIIPMVLVNGSKGIGTGFSTEILCYNPVQIINYLLQKLEPSEVTILEDFVPYYEGFKGQITRLTDSKFLIKGLYEEVNEDTIRVTELPVGFWTQDFRVMLDDLVLDKEKERDVGKKTAAPAYSEPAIKSYTDISGVTQVDCTIQFAKGRLEELTKQKLDNGCNGVEKLLKLFTTVSTTNMRLFDANDKLKKYESVPEIIDDYFVTRLELYEKRRQHLIATLQKEMIELSSKVRFIQENLEGVVDLRRKTKAEVADLLFDRGYPSMSETEYDYDYLTRMPMHSVTAEHVERMNRDFEKKQSELATVQATTANQMWVQELQALRVEYNNFVKERSLFLEGLDEDSSSESSEPAKKKLRVVNSSKPKKVIKSSNVVIDL